MTGSSSPSAYDEARTDRVRVTFALPVDRVGTDLVSGPAIAELASAYEHLGFDAAFVTDHPAPDDRWLAAGGHHALEPTVALTAAAMVTERLGLHTNVYVLPYRNPFLAAKALASLDVLSGGRLILGVAAGYLRPEFRALGADFERRGRSLEESLAVLRRLWTESSVEGRGDGWEARSVTALPQPTTPPPVWIGGNSGAALRRAVELGQGWSPFPTPMSTASGAGDISSLDALRERIGRVRELCDAAERIEPLTICFVPFSQPDYLSDPDRGLGRLVDETASLHEMGVDWVALTPPGESRSAVLEHAHRLADALGCS